MGERLRRFYANVGLAGSLYALVGHLLLAGLLLFVLLVPEFAWYVPLIPAMVWTLPYLARRALTDRPRRALKLHDGILYTLVVVGALLREPLARLGELAVVLVLSGLAAMLGIHWWLLSDPELRATG